MKTKSLDNKEADDKKSAVVDAAARNIKLSKAYSSSAKLQAERMKSVLSTMYNTTGVYVNYREKFISVKVAAPASVNDRALQTKNEEEWEKAGITKLKTAQGIIYHLP